MRRRARHLAEHLVPPQVEPLLARPREPLDDLPHALPAGVVLDARLLDVSRADAPATPLARAVVVTAGEQVPLPFSLTYAPGAIEKGHRYIVEATLTLDGRARFRSTTMHPVLQDGTQSGPVEIVVQPIR